MIVVNWNITCQINIKILLLKTQAKNLLYANWCQGETRIRANRRKTTAGEKHTVVRKQ